MDNITIKNMILNHYINNSASKDYIMGVNMNGNIYMVHVTDEDLKDITRVESAGHNDGYTLRYKPNNTIRTYLLSKGATVLCSTLYFEQMVKASKYNKGEVFERLVTEWYGQEWYKDNINYRVQGDITIDGIEYQIKYERGGFISEGQIRREREERK